MNIFEIFYNQINILIWNVHNKETSRNNNFIKNDTSSFLVYNSLIVELNLGLLH